MLDHYENTNPHWIVAERTSLACLLLPAADDELHRIDLLVDQALTSGPKPPHSDFAYLQYVNGLAEYRQGRAQNAIPMLQEAAPILFNRAGPQLALAMAQFQLGDTGNARRTLAKALLAFDWKERQDEPTPMWVNHVLRREAEKLILPNVQQFVDGEYKPQDRDELEAMLGASQFVNRPLPVVVRYADALSAVPGLVRDLRFDHLYHAACSAAQAGGGQGENVARVSETEQARFRGQARAWLREDLIEYRKALDDDPANNLQKVRRQIALWQSDPDLAILRESSALEKFTENERTDCLALWAEIGDLLSRCKSDK